MKKDLTNILITGYPGVGKTTLIKKLCDSLAAFNPVGFYTQEVRQAGVRRGFELVSLDGRRSLLSHIDIRSDFRVSKYGVDVAGFEAFLDSLNLPQWRGLVVIDEIGKMESFSEKFRHVLRCLLDSENIVIATIALKGGGLIAEIKSRPDVRLFEITAGSRDRMPDEILSVIKRQVI